MIAQCHAWLPKELSLFLSVFFQFKMLKQSCNLPWGTIYIYIHTHVYIYIYIYTFIHIHIICSNAFEPNMQAYGGTMVDQFWSEGYIACVCVCVFFVKRLVQRDDYMSSDWVSLLLVVFGDLNLICLFLVELEIGCSHPITPWLQTTLIPCPKCMYPMVFSGLKWSGQVVDGETKRTRLTWSGNEPSYMGVSWNRGTPQSF